MRSPFTRKQASLAAFCALALGGLSATAGAQVPSDEKALITDARGAPVMNSSGQCWHNGFGPAPLWTLGCHAAPAPVALYVAPTPAAQPVAAAAQPVYEKVAFDADVLFDSDKSALRPAGRDSLDDFVGRMKGLDTQAVLAVGYADRMGSEGANQILSQERVNAVKAYLVGKGIAAERVQISAKGEMRPSTATGECAEANNAKNVACMQPDRHVSIEVSGTRLAQ
jgi:OOP family OmpA-OmpF porin